MSESFKLEAFERTEKVNKVRHNNMIPAVVYGNNFKNTSISIDQLTFKKIFREAGTSHLIDLKIGDAKSVKTLVHDIQLDPKSGDVIHIDFFKVNMKEKITAEIPLVFTGASPAVINLDGSLINPIDAIEIECLPADLPSEITIDISILDDFEKNIKISDLEVAEGVTILNEPEEIIVFVQEPRSEEEMAELEEEVVENVDAIEVENKGEETPAEGGETEEKAE